MIQCAWLLPGSLQFKAHLGPLHFATLRLQLCCLSKSNLYFKHPGKLSSFHISQFMTLAATTVATTWEAAPAPALVPTMATAVMISTVSTISACFQNKTHKET